jgi:D-alanyl-D-alanine carboxypeptidase (penicillin-binding protein 5/6)
MLKDRRRKERRFRRCKQVATVAVPVLIVLILVLVLVGVFHSKKKNPRYIEPDTQTPQATETESTQTEEIWSYEAVETDETATFPDTVVSQNGILIDVEAGEIIAGKGAHDRIVPASMTKVLTVLVAAENITPEQLNEVVTISREATDYSYSNDCSSTGYEVDEQVTVQDLFYGTILPSGADSAYTLATYVSGSHEQFVVKMNEKLEELGLSETSHMTNCVGLYDEDHYSTPYDIAVILKAATDNEFCRRVLSAKKYTTSLTEEHPEGLLISNWFLRRIEDLDTHGEVLCAKTGYVNQSGSCAASLACDSNGREYICVTAGSTTSWRCIYDQVDIYDSFLPEVPETTLTEQ